MQNMTIVEAPPPMNNTLTPNTDDTLVEKTDLEKCAAILSHIMESQHAFEFLRPVDPIKQGIPSYSKVIKEPMDLGTVKAKLANNDYTDPRQFDQDVRLVFKNCYTFNPPNTYVYGEAQQLEKEYKREWRQWFGEKRKAEEVFSTPPTSEPRMEAVPRKEGSRSADMTSSNSRRCLRMVEKLWVHASSEPFRHPVSALKQNY